ncbi:MAG: endonuclease domain-containing protein [Candidatus Margulisbacteria bacterium]|nr:endonuclease domain-containing protein [Candidatus Margulisiibacteriota bacterium]
MKEIKKKFARTMRKKPTKAEKIVWELLHNRKFNGYKFRRQHVIEGFILDFYCHELRLGIEVDGSIHFKRQEYDRLRQDIIESECISILRITNNELKERKRSIIDKLTKLLADPQTPLPMGEGSKERTTDKEKIG